MISFTQIFENICKCDSIYTKFLNFFTLKFKPLLFILHPFRTIMVTKVVMIQNKNLGDHQSDVDYQLNSIQNHGGNITNVTLTFTPSLEYLTMIVYTTD